jgi:hypothetical protein
LVGLFSRIEDEIAAANDAGLLPHLQVGSPGRVAAAQRQAATWKAAADHLLVLGEPSAVDAALLAARSAGPSCEGQPLALTSPDPVVLAGLLAHGGTRRQLVVLDGPAWVRRVATALAGAAEGVTVYAGDGAASDGWTLENADRVADPGCSDARFAAFGAAGLAIAAWAGEDAARLEASLVAASGSSRGRGLLQNAAWKWAASAHLLSPAAEVCSPTLLVPSARLSALGRVLSATWMTITIRRQATGARWSVQGVGPELVVAGDEARVPMMLHRSTWAMAVWSENPGPASHPVAAAAWQEARGLTGAHIRQIAEAGIPVLRVRSVCLDAAGCLALAWTGLHAALGFALARELPPLEAPDADRLRILQEPDDADTRGS